MDTRRSPGEAGRHPPFGVAVDLVVLTIRDGALSVLLVRRGAPPFQGLLALPGGFVKAGSDADLDYAARRELREETSLDLPTATPQAGPQAGAGAVHLEQLRAYWRPGRDPRQDVATVAYLAVAPDPGEPAAGGDAAAVRWVPVDDVLSDATTLAFDHRQIVADGVERARQKLEGTALAAAFVPPEFTIAELRQVYEAVWGRPLDKRNFHRKVTGAQGFLVSTGRRASRGRGRPAELFRRGPARTLNPPITRPDGAPPHHPSA